MENVIEKSSKLNIWRIFIYFAFYSFIGFVLETIFGMFTKGVIESRQSFLFGPFCAIYGIGAILMITFLSNFKNNNAKLFFGSILIGTLAEYSMSYFCEHVFHFKWWDYSGMYLNLNGRTCLYFSVMWGILGIVLIKYLNPILNKFIDFLKSKIHVNILKFFTLVIIRIYSNGCKHNICWLKIILRKNSK